MKRILSKLKWLYPGMGVKRWILLNVVGIGLFVVGVAVITNVKAFDYIQKFNDFIDWLGTNTPWVIQDQVVLLPIGLGIAAIGLYCICVSVIRINRSVVTAVAPDAGEIADVMFLRRHLAHGQRLVVLGGGTGLSTMLRGLKEHTSNIAAIVTVTDNGGSSGKLIKQMGVLPPGDLRNCLVALADAEPVLSKLFQYRFETDDQGLAGHSFGNLFIAAMSSLYDGNYERAITATSKVLAIRGKVYPSTVNNVCLLAEMEDGEVIEGETQIAENPQPIRQIYLRPENAQPLPEALEAIRNADAIILGPGSVYTSIIPNLLVEGVAAAIARSKAIKVYVCNVMTQRGETEGFAASDHLRVVAEHAPGKRLFTHVLVNTERPAPDVLEYYQKYGQRFVEPDVDTIRAMGYIPVTGKLISKTDIVRHDPTQLANAIYRIIL